LHPFFASAIIRSALQGEWFDRLTDSHEDMLVITRKIGESLIIDGDITVTVVKVAGGGVRLGIQAPSEYVIVRDELRDSSNNETQALPARSKKS
jgi:carbon storage regulator